MIICRKYQRQEYIGRQRDGNPLITKGISKNYPQAESYWDLSLDHSPITDTLSTADRIRYELLHRKLTIPLE